MTSIMQPLRRQKGRIYCKRIRHRAEKICSCRTCAVVAHMLVSSFCAEQRRNCSASEGGLASISVLGYTALAVWLKVATIKMTCLLLALAKQRSGGELAYQHPLDYNQKIEGFILSDPQRPCLFASPCTRRWGCDSWWHLSCNATMTRHLHSHYESDEL